jgi:peroxiredoxin
MSPVPHDPTVLPPDLPVPADDGAADGLLGRSVPALVLPSTLGGTVELAEAAREQAVFFFYPRTGVPGRPPPRFADGTEWDLVPGLRGCTPQYCGFRDLLAEFRALGVAVLAISTQTSTYQREFAGRMHIPFPILSDSELMLTRALALPALEVPPHPGGPTTVLKRMTWYCARGRIEHVWYPVFPPDQDAARVLAWLRDRKR